MATKHNAYWPFEDISITDLYLDQDNIRLPLSSQTQDALIQDLFANEDALEIVKSYVQNGVFSDEFPLVIKEKNKFIVIEGNRRIAALKALNEPSLVPIFKERIKALKNPKITSVRVVLAPNRAAAIKHIANKHTRNYRRSWKPLRQAYFYKSQLDNGKTIAQLINEYPEQEIPKFIKMLEMHHIAKSQHFDDEVVKYKVHDERNFPITTLERLYSNTNIQEFLGLSFDEKGSVKIAVKKDEFNKGYKKIIEDIANEEINSRNTNNGEQISAYIKTLSEEHKPDKSKKASLASPSFKEEKVDKTQIDKHRRSNKKTKGLFRPSNVPYKLGSTALRFLYDEIKDINVSTFPNATHDLLRTFLECVLLNHLKSTGEYKQIQKNPKHVPTLSEMLSFVMSERCTSIEDMNIKQIINQIKTDYDKPYSLVMMNMVNHNENLSSSEKDVRLAWSKIENLIITLLNPPKKKK